MRKTFKTLDDFINTAKNVPAELELNKVLQDIKYKTREAMADKDIEHLKECRQKLLYWLTELEPYKGSPTIQPIASKIRRIELLISEIKTFLEDNGDFKLSKPKRNGLAVKQVVLIHIYEGIQITRQNGGEIAKAHGLTSGEKLYKTYLEYAHATDRKGDPGTPRKLKEKIKLFESVVPLLKSEAAIKRATAELEILKRIHH